MPTKRKSKTNPSLPNERPLDAPEANDDNSALADQGGVTGRFLVLMRDKSAKAAFQALKHATGLRAATSSDFAQTSFDVQTLGGAEAMIFEHLGVAVVDASPDQSSALSIAANRDDSARHILVVEPERIVYALSEDSSSQAMSDYLRGYRDAVNHLTGQLLGHGDEGSQGITAAGINEDALTWGLQVTNAGVSRLSGRGIRIAVLDTGFDVGHPDFVGRNVVTQSFINGETIQDVHGHGTHCIGTACGSLRPTRLPRYGVAYNADIYAGKVLSNSGRGGDSGVLAGIDWALTNQCAVISMSLGAPVQIGQPFSPIYETVAKRALAAGTLLIAAAGNESRRPSRIAPVGHPANCPSVMAVAAIDEKIRIADFSNGGLQADGGQVDIAAPGVKIRSSVPRPRRTEKMNGTSMATPHVAGIAALWAESDPTARGLALWVLLTSRARRLSLPSRDVGIGLVQAP